MILKSCHENFKIFLIFFKNDKTVTHSLQKRGLKNPK